MAMFHQLLWSVPLVLLAISGGLVTSLFAALLVVPVLHRALAARPKEGRG